VLHTAKNIYLLVKNLVCIYDIRDSSAGIPKGYRLDDHNSISGKSKIFLFFMVSRLYLRFTQPPIQWVPADLSLVVKQLGCKAVHSPTYNVKVKNGGGIPPIIHTSSWLGV
jgi:hypothetical protein